VSAWSTELTDVDRVASDFADVISLSINSDIETEFPETQRQYGTRETGIENLRRLQYAHTVGEKELFIVTEGSVAVGQAIITISKKPPQQRDPAWSNVSGWLAHPYRGRGLGKFSLQERLKIVCDHFAGAAWTYVNKKNYISEANVKGLGFMLLTGEVENWPQHNLFTWQQKRQR